MRENNELDLDNYLNYKSPSNLLREVEKSQNTEETWGKNGPKAYRGIYKKGKWRED